MKVIVKCGIYKSDAVFLWWFCIGLNCPSHNITKSAYVFRFKNGVTTIFYLYMNDIKLQGIDSLIHLTKNHHEDTGMSFGLDKCGRTVRTG